MRIISQPGQKLISREEVSRSLTLELVIIINIILKITAN